MSKEQIIKKLNEMLGRKDSDQQQNNLLFVKYTNYIKK
mgnify:CR=1 FL=1